MNKKNLIKSIDNLNFLTCRFQSFKIINYKQYVYNRHSFNLYTTKGSLNLNSKNLGIYRYFKSILSSKEKLKTFSFKKIYLLKRKFKKKYKRIKIFIKKNNLIQDIKDFNFFNKFYTNMLLIGISKYRLNCNKYNLTPFFLIKIKLKFFKFNNFL